MPSSDTSEAVSAIALSPDASTPSGDPGTLQFWDISTGSPSAAR